MNGNDCESLGQCNDLDIVSVLPTELLVDIFSHCIMSWVMMTPCYKLGGHFLPISIDAESNVYVVPGGISSSNPCGSGPTPMQIRA